MSQWPGLKRVVVFRSELVDRPLHESLRSHYADHPDVAVVLVVERIGVHDLSAVAPYGISAVIRTGELTARPGLLTAVRNTVAQGGYRLPPNLGATVRNAVAQPAQPRRPIGRPGVLLRPFDLTLVTLAAQGCTTDRSAQHLGKSPMYVKTARRRLFQKLGVTGITACVGYAAREGLLWHGEDGETS
ncbi:DNA-binding response regulator [Streptomyces sp. CS7]|uniref:helix-turn-helix transcriptional regulator n=1 Tax=Streptomyces sp. CS-7 TaxID=2906769 RepID=UPI0021B3B24F|nr:DNA-binding response regulator [Streptomyces sp. CS-7]MCT6780552.1 DNA-binding response regulator [Streptomyces sp. CS-7]